MFCPQPYFLYGERPVPQLSNTPSCVYSTPGLGHIVQDYSLYVPLYASHVPSVKEVEKSIDPLPSRGGIELNPPLILVGKKKGTRKRSVKNQKGAGQKRKKETQNTLSEKESREVETALKHPIKVHFKLTNKTSLFFLY